MNGTVRPASLGEILPYGLFIVILRLNSNVVGVTRSEIFTDKQNQVAAMFKALAHPARIAILQYIIRQNACICNDLVEELGLAQATISQHLKELKSAGLIKGNIEGTSVCYCIDEKVWLRFKKELNLFFTDRVTVHKCC